MNGDLGCVKTVYVPEEEVSAAGAPYKNGILLTYEDMSGGKFLSLFCPFCQLLSTFEKS